MWNAFFGSGDEQYDSLKAWTNQIRGLFGDDWTDFFENVGKNLYKIFNGNEYEKDEALREVQNWLNDINDVVKKSFSVNPIRAVFVEWANEALQNLGSFLAQAQTRFTQYLKDNGITSYGDYVSGFLSGKLNISDMYKAVFSEYTSGSGTHISSSGAVHGGGGGSFGNDGGGDRYRYQTYDTPTASTYSSSGLLKSGYGLEDAQKSDRKLSLTITNMLDGAAVGEYSAEYSMRELARSNGY